MASEAVVLGQSEARRVSTEVSFGQDGGLVAFTADDTHVSVRRLDADGQVLPGESSVALTNARDLFGLYRLAHYDLLLSHAVCPGGRHMNKCLALRALASDGSAAGPEHVETTREWMLNPVLRVDGDSLIVLRGHRYIASVLERYQVAADGSISREALGNLDFDEDSGEPPTPLGLAVDSGRWAALVRDYDSRRDRSILRLYRSDGAASVLPLRVRDGLSAGDLAFVDGGLRLLLASTSGRPRIVELDQDAHVRERSRTLSADETLDANRALPSVASDHRRLVFSRHDLAGRAIGEPLPLGRGDSAAVDGEGARFVAAAVLRSRSEPSTVSLRAIRCQVR